jgi:hypothetical protein
VLPPAATEWVVDSSTDSVGSGAPNERAGGSLRDGRSRLSPRSSILAIVPHFRCEAWLPDCLESLLGQTRRPDAIVVVDDASGEPPVEGSVVTVLLGVSLGVSLTGSPIW